jgi:hypothetical protein
MPRKLTAVAGGRTKATSLLLAFEDYRLTPPDWVMARVSLSRKNLDWCQQQFTNMKTWHGHEVKLDSIRIASALPEAIGAQDQIKGVASIASLVAMSGDASWEIAPSSAKMSTMNYNRAWLEVSRSQHRWVFETMGEDEAEICTVWVPQSAL